MKKLLAAGLLLLSVVLAACSSDEKTKEPAIVFKGEGTDWESAYYYYEVDDNAYDYEFILTYKGNPKELMEKYDQITMEYGVGTIRMDGTLPIKFANADKKLFFKSSGSFEGVNLLNDDIKIDLYLQWGKNVDSFLLTKTK